MKMSAEYHDDKRSYFLYFWEENQLPSCIKLSVEDFSRFIFILNELILKQKSSEGVH